LIEQKKENATDKTRLRNECNELMKEKEAAITRGEKESNKKEGI